MGCSSSPSSFSHQACGRFQRPSIVIVVVVWPLDARRFFVYWWSSKTTQVIVACPVARRRCRPWRVLPASSGVWQRQQLPHLDRQRFYLPRIDVASGGSPKRDAARAHQPRQPLLRQLDPSGPSLYARVLQPLFAHLAAPPGRSRGRVSVGGRDDSLSARVYAEFRGGTGCSSASHELDDGFPTAYFQGWSCGDRANQRQSLVLFGSFLQRKVDACLSSELDGWSSFDSCLLYRHCFF